MPFSLTNAPMIFMDLMNRICKPCIDKFVIVFIDGILIYLKSKEEHEAHLKLILELLEKEKLFGKFSKCEFWLQEIAKPQTLLTQKNKKFEWGDEQETAFQTLKDMLCDALILALVREDFKAEKLARLYINEIVARHDVPVSIISDRDSIHDTFHVSNLRKCLANANLHVPLEEIKIYDKQRLAEELIEILDHEVKKLKRSWIPIVKVHWNSRQGPEFTWKREYDMKRKNKMHKAFPVPVMEFPLPEEVPTASSTSDGTGKKKGRTVTLTTDDMQKRKNDVKVRTTLLLSLPDEHKLRFSKYKTAQELWAAILKTFSGNKATKKTNKNLLKQQHGNFKAKGSETLEQTFNRLKRNRSDLDTMSLDDLYNHLNVYESEVQKKSNLNSQNMAFISLAKHNSGNEEVNIASGSTASINVSTASANIGVATISQDTACAYITSQFSGSEGLPEARIEEGETTTYKGLKLKNRLQKQFALMAKTSAKSEVFENSLCFKACKKNSDSLNSKIIELIDKLYDAKNMIYHYKLRLAQVEARLAEHRSQELKYYKKIRVLEFNTESRANCIESLKKDLELLKKEKGYSVVPPPPAQVYSPPKKDMSWTGLPEFKDDTVSDYSRPSPTIECTLDDAQNKNPSITKIEASPNTVSPKPFIKFVKANDSPTKSKTDKVKTAKKPPVKNIPTGSTKFSTADIGKKENIVKASAFQNNIDDKGYWDSSCSRHMTGNISYLSNYKPFDGGYVSFGQGGCKITGKGTIKTGKIKFENVYFVKDPKKPQDNCSFDVPKSSGNSNPTATSINPSADQIETLTVETPISTVSSPVLTTCFTDPQEHSSDTRLISKRVANQVEKLSLDNILKLTNRFEDILKVTTNSDELNGVEADVSNMETTITTSPTPTLKIRKDHPKIQIIGHVDTPIQTRNKSKEVGEQSFIAIIHQKTDPALLQFCIFSCFLSQIEPKKISDGLQDPSWEEGIDYDEVFAPVTRIKAIKLFLAYASFMRFTVYQMDVKSAFLYGTINEEVYVMQPPGFQDPEFPARVYKVEKAMYDYIRLQEPDKYVGDILKRFRYSDVRSANTPMDKENPWGKDGTRKDVDLHLYRSMIGSLMYLTASRPDIMFVVCAYARHQVTPKECHLYAVKRIFRYLKGHPKLRLWYPKESLFDLMAYSDS
nr:hypothetical protein [Tanacetum cinerariifolium]